MSGVDPSAVGLDVDGGVFVDAGIPFIALVGDGPKFEVHERAKAVLRSCRGRVCVVAVAGLYRTGKSFLVNRIVGTQSGFTVGPTVEACTKGIWMWGRPIETTLRDGEPASVIVLDTEGIGGTNATSQHDARVFSLATLLCSHLIYNSLGSITEDAIANLGFIANLTKHIHVSSHRGAGGGDGEAKAAGAGGAAGAGAAADGGGGGGDGDGDGDGDGGGGDDDGAAAAAAADEADSQAYSAFFPSFWWVVRDFALDLRDEHGDEITSKQYLELSLEDKPGFSDKKMRNNRIRHCINAFFKNRDCVTLVRPLQDEAALQEVDKQPWESLREVFREQVTGFRNRLMREMPPKQLNGTDLNGSMLVSLATMYVEAVNADGVPTISSAWASITANECDEAVQAAYKTYRAALTRELDGWTGAGGPQGGALPLDDGPLRKLNGRLQQDAVRVYEGRAIGDEQAEFKVKLWEKLDAAADDLVEANGRYSQVQCQRAASECYDKHKPGVITSGGGGGGGDKDKVMDVRAEIAGMKAAMEAMKADYLAMARGPAKLQVLADFEETTMFDAMKKLAEAQDEAHRKVLQDQKDKMRKTEEELAQKTSMEAVMKKRVETAISESADKVSQIARLDAESKGNKEFADRQTERLKVLQKDADEAKRDADKQLRDLLREKEETAAKLRAMEKERDDLSGQKGELEAKVQQLSAGGGCCITM